MDDKKIGVIEEGDKIHLTYSQDIETLLKVNHEQRAARSRFDRKGEWHHVMRIPQVVLMEIERVHGLSMLNPEHSKQIMALLKGPEFAAFRTYDGAI